MGHYAKKGDALVPQDQETLDWLRKKKEGQVFELNERNVRNYPFLKKCMALFRLGHENTQMDLPFEAYRNIMTMKAGFYDAYNTGKGVHFEAKSLAFDKMDEETFRDVYKRVREKISEDIGATNEQIDGELQNFY